MANSDEDKKEDKTSAPASEQEKESDETKVDDTTKQADAEKNDKIDYAAELEKAQTRISQAEHTIVELRKKKEPVTEEPSVEEDVVDQKISEGFSKIQQQLASTAIASTLASLSDDPDERKLILFHYQNSIKTTGITPDAILTDLENAKILANRRKLIRENSEIKRAVIAKNNTTGAGAGSNQDKQEVEAQPTVKVTAAEAALLARRGLKPENVKVSSSTAAKR
jgi:hypothetical protein